MPDMGRRRACGAKVSAAASAAGAQNSCSSPGADTLSPDARAKFLRAGALRLSWTSPSPRPIFSRGVAGPVALMGLDQAANAGSRAGLDHGAADDAVHRCPSLAKPRAVKASPRPCFQRQQQSAADGRGSGRRPHHSCRAAHQGCARQGHELVRLLEQPDPRYRSIVISRSPWWTHVATKKARAQRRVRVRKRVAVETGAAACGAMGCTSAKLFADNFELGGLCIWIPEGWNNWALAG